MKRRETYRCTMAGAPGALAVLDLLEAQGRVAADHRLRKGDRIKLILTDTEIRLLEDHGVVVKKETSLEQLAEQRLKERAKPNAAVPDSGGFISGFVDHYLDAAEVSSRVASLVASFPLLCHLSTLPFATSGYDGAVGALHGPASVQLLRITNNPADHGRPALLLLCGTHAREWINPLIAIEYAEQLVRNYDPASSDPEIHKINRIIEEGEVFILPVVNPDGLNYSIHDSAGWRKNRQPNPANPACPGVDLNRNFEVYFGGAGSSSLPCPETYRGPYAFSEPETCNIRWVLEQHPNIVIGIDSHSFGNAFYRPNPSGGAYISGEPVCPEDEAIYAHLENAANAAIMAAGGAAFSTGTTNNHAGTSDEYMFLGHRVFGFNFECAEDFQPAIADALISIRQVTAALRALAIEAVDLHVVPATPCSIVQSIDRTGSMVAFGYEASTRQNARRLIDLMSIGDKVGVVSFSDPSSSPTGSPLADQARVEFPLSLITGPGVFDAARSAVDGIVFGGWTPIGAGLTVSADQLTGITGKRAIILLSDGFENRPPTVANVLATFPASLPVYTIALGPFADVPLLQSIAMNTGGTFHSSPGALDLYEIYNQIRAAITDDGVVVNETCLFDNDQSEQEFDAYIEQGALQTVFSVAWETGTAPRVSIIDPYGCPISEHGFGIDVIERVGYRLVKICRPKPGAWRMVVASTTGHVNVAVFVRSNIHVDITCAGEPGYDRRFAFDLRARIGADPASITHVQVRSSKTVTPPNQISGKRRKTFGELLDAGAEALAQACMQQSVGLSPVKKRLPNIARIERIEPCSLRYSLSDRSPKSGVHSIRLHIIGKVGERVTFERTHLVTRVVPALKNIRK